MGNKQTWFRTILCVMALLLIGTCYGWADVGTMIKQLTLASNGKTDYVIALGANHSPAEQHAAQELAGYLKKVTGAEFAIVSPEERGTRSVLAVGPGAARILMPELDLSDLGQDGVVIQSSAPHVILTGGTGALRGTLYAVYSFLEDNIGCRWWSSKVSDIPTRTTLVIPELSQRHVPPFEYREPYLFSALDPDWAVHNKCNGQFFHLDEKRGGYVGYSDPKKGFVHTFDRMLPPDKFFPKHPEWFGEIDGKRVGKPKVQWCLTNPELLAFIIQRVKDILHDAPPDSIVSVSQNDGIDKGCQCNRCLAIEKEEGSPSGPLLRFVNAIADAIKDGYPRAAIDTLAYGYTTKPPRITKPRSNVIIRLCVNPCSINTPLESGTFAEVARGWSKICQRIYIWDYVTDFQHYMLPLPNVRVLGSNIRFFEKNGAKGIFSQGAFNSPGTEFNELRSWVLAKLMWNPALNDRALVQEFVNGYYGAAAPNILEYIQLLHDTSEQMTNFWGMSAPVTIPYLTLDLLTKAETLFQKAEASVQREPDILNRVQMTHASIQYVVLSRWPMLKQEAQSNGQPWVFGESMPALLNRFTLTCNTNKVTHFNEQRMEPMFMRLHTYGTPGQRPGIEPPSMCKELKNSDWIDFQENDFRRNQWISKLWIEYRSDAKAANGQAAWMPGSHREWAVQVDIPFFVWMDEPNDEWVVYADVRVVKKGKGEGAAFTCGIHDVAESKGPKRTANPPVNLSDINDDAYHAYKIGVMGMSPSSLVWLAPTKNENNVESIWVDRIYMIRQTQTNDKR